MANGQKAILRRLNVPLSRHFIKGGRYWVRTSDPFGVNEVRYHCANRPACAANRDAETIATGPWPLPPPPNLRLREHPKKPSRRLRFSQTYDCQQHLTSND